MAAEYAFLANRVLVACSYAYPKLIKSKSEKAVPRKDRPQDESSHFQGRIQAVLETSSIHVKRVLKIGETGVPVTMGYPTIAAS